MTIARANARNAAMPTTLPAMIARFVEDEVVDCGALSREVNTA